jgi:group II intron reverse transcriptase/maturase
MLTEFKLNLISIRAKKDKTFRFSNLMHMVNEWSLKSSFYMLKKNKAAGVDEVTLKEYEENLDSNIAELLRKMKQMSYRPQPVRRVYIPKENGKLRGLGIPTVEDRMVQMAMSRVLEAIYEQDFFNFSYGFRPGRNCHQALAVLDHTLMWKPVNYVIDADIKGFFDNVNHEALIRCLEERISDERFIRYIVRFLKSGIMEDGKYLKTGMGTPQGGVISPILANIYLHYALDKWYMKENVSLAEGYVKLIRYADDFIVCAQHKSDAERILRELRSRLDRCHLELSEEKTRLVRFGRYAQRKWDEERGKGNKRSSNWRPGTFNFLGFTHYCGKSRRGKFKVSRRTEKKRFMRSAKRVSIWLKSQRNRRKLKEIWYRAGQMLSGHYRYYGVTENSRQIHNFYDKMQRLLFKWLNRRSQKKSMNWEKFKEYLKAYPLPKPRIYHNLPRYALWLSREQ